VETSRSPKTNFKDNGTDRHRLAHVIYGIFGTGGFGREGMALAREACLACPASAADFDLIFVEHEPAHARIDGYTVLSLGAFAALEGVERRFNVLVADTKQRQRIVLECEALGLVPFTIRSRLAEVHPTARIGEGAVLCQFTLVSANAIVGRYFHLNHHGYVSHDCRIGDFVTFAPAVRCNGTIEIGDLAYISSGATLRQGTPQRRMHIGAGAIVGMGAVVLNSIDDKTTVVGNPARVLPRRT
jgi:sugar O-acyltransferase (sialic acid O-acetyltransferase NeuD family)